MLIYAIKIWISTETCSQFCVTHKLPLASIFRVSIQLDLTGQAAAFSLCLAPRKPLPITKLSRDSVLLSLTWWDCHCPKKQPNHSVAQLSTETSHSMLNLLLPNTLPGNLITQFWSRRDLGDHLRLTSLLLRREREGWGVTCSGHSVEVGQKPRVPDRSPNCFPSLLSEVQSWLEGSKESLAGS